MNRIPILGPLVAAALLIVPSVLATTIPVSAAGFGDSHQFGAVTYLDNSGVDTIFDVTNPNPQVDDPSTMLDLGITVAQMNHCDMLIPEPGGDGGGDPPADPGPSDGDGGGSNGEPVPADSICYYHLRL